MTTANSAQAKENRKSKTYLRKSISCSSNTIYTQISVERLRNKPMSPQQKIEESTLLKSMKKLLPILLLPLLFVGCGVTTTDGEHTGNVVAVEKNGLIWKTTVVYIKSDAQSSQEDKYCVENVEVENSLREAAKTKAIVTVKYHDEFIVAPWRCEGDEVGIIDSVELK